MAVITHKTLFIAVSLISFNSYANTDYTLPFEVANPNPIQAPNAIDNITTPIKSGITNAISNNTPPATASYKVSSSPVKIDEYGREIAQAVEEVNPLYSSAKQKWQPQQNITIAPGGNVILPISRGLQNRISTTFKNVAVSTSDRSANILAYGSDVIITTNEEAPLGIMLYEDGVPDTTYNLTLIPLDVPGAMIAIDTQLSKSQVLKQQEYAEKIQSAKLLEQALVTDDPIYYQDDHKQRVINILTPIAQGQTPPGFSLQIKNLNKLPKNERQPCGFSFHTEIGQRLIGAKEIVDIILVRNTTSQVQVVLDQQCLTKGVIATGLFDKAYLQPGQETELYIIRDKTLREREARINTRPSLLKQK